MRNVIATIQKQVSGGEELKVLPRSDFKLFQKWQKEARDAFNKVHRGRQEYQMGKTIVAPSPKLFR